MRSFRWWQVLITLVFGAVGVGMIVSAIVSLIVAAFCMDGFDWSTLSTDVGSIARFQEALVAATRTMPVVATSLLITAVGFAGSPFVVAKLTRVDIRAALGFATRPHFAALVAAPIGILALGPLSDVIVELARRVAPNATFGALDELNAIAQSAPIWVLIPFLAMCPGFGEEVLFRGFIQRSIGNGVLAIVVSAVSFALIHVDPHHVAGVIPLGFFLAWSAARTDSTWVSIVAHVANNTAALISARVLSGDDAAHAGPFEVMGGLVVCAACVAVIDRTSRRANADTNAAQATPSA